jgi:Matrixin
MTNSRPRLMLEQLEDRITPTNSGMPWLDPQHMTLSFAPDGTDTGNGSSMLFQALNAQVPTATWQQEILRAFQTWAVNANINIGLMADSGDPLGAPGLVQGDSRFGDIRIAGMPQTPEVVATGAPFMLNGSTRSGDVLFNTNYSFSAGDQGGYDVFSVVLHEAGHVFGLGDGTDPNSVMYHNYLQVRSGLSPQDLSNFQALYGTRQPDQYEARWGNDSFKTATQLGQFTRSLPADITTLADADYYQFTVSAGDLSANGVTVQVQTSEISLLVPSLTIYDSAFHKVAFAAADSPLDGDLSLTLGNAARGQTYYAVVGNATQSVFGIGSYQLKIGSQTDSSSGANGASYGQGNFSSWSGYLDNNGSILTATSLPISRSTNRYFDASIRAAIGSATDLDYYRIHAPTTPNNAPEQMIAMAWGLDLNGLTPQISVFDAAGNPVDAQVIGNANGFFSLDIANAGSNMDYFLAVSALSPTSNAVGSYFFGVQFNNHQTVNFQTVSSGALTQDSSTLSQTLTVNEAGGTNFILSANTGGIAAPAQVQMNIYDQSGNLVFTLTANEGAPARTAIAYLNAGTYTVSFTALAQGTTLVSPVYYNLKAETVTDPIGPMPVPGSTTDPPAPPTYTTSTTSYSTFTTTTTVMPLYTVTATFTTTYTTTTVTTNTATWSSTTATTTVSVVMTPVSSGGALAN